MLTTLLEEIDIIGSKFHFYQGKTPKRKTIFGGFLTLFMLVTFFALVIIFGSDFFTRKNPVVTISIENNNKYEIIDLKKENIFFAFRIEDYNGNFINASDILYFKIYYYTSDQDKNGVYRSIIHDENITYHICNYSDFDVIELTKNYGTLFCPDLGGKQFGGYWDSPNLYYFEIQVFFCENGAYYSSNNSKCTSLDTLRDFLNQDNPKFFAFYYPIIEFNPYSYSKPIIKRYKIHYCILNYRLQRNDDVFLKKTIMNDDKGWLFNHYKNFSDWGIDSFSTTYFYFSDSDLNTEGVSTKIYELNLYTAMEKNYYSRYYMKFQNIIAIAGSLINLIFYICEMLSAFIGDNILKLEIIQNTFDFSDNRKYEKAIFKRSHTFLGDSKHYCNAFDALESHIIHLKIGTLKHHKKKIKIKKIPTFSFQDRIHFKKKKDNNLIDSKINFDNSQNKISTNIMENSNYYTQNNNNKKLLNENFILQNIDINNRENSGNNLLLKVKTQPIENSKFSALKINNSKMRTERIRMYIFFCCYNQKLYHKIFKTKNSHLIHWYYMHLMQTDRYFELIKQFDFLKKILLNEGQINSLEFLKKIDLKNEEEKDNLLFIKKHNIENIVISYFREALKSGNISRSDAFIYDNLSDKIKKCIL